MADDTELVARTAHVVEAYLTNNRVEAGAVGELITAIHASLAAASQGGEAVDAGPEIEQPTAAAIRKSITPDYLISFIDGRKFKTLRRHLSLQGLTPEAYRARYGLPASYPMTSPNYSAARSKMALAAGLGQQGRVAKASPKGRKAKA